MELSSRSHDCDADSSSSLQNARSRTSSSRNSDSYVSRSGRIEESSLFPRKIARRTLCIDAISQDDGNNLETELPVSHSNVEHLTHQIKELQDVVYSLSESQDFTVLQTASASGSAHAPGKPSFFLFFHDSFAATAATVLAHGIWRVFQETFLMTPVSILLHQKQRQQAAQKLLQWFLLNWPGETWCTETSKQVLRKSSPSLNGDLSEVCRRWNCLRLWRKIISAKIHGRAAEE